MTGRGNNGRGFTLLELLVAVSLLAVVTGLVYQSFASVTEATAIARKSAEELRLARFLTQRLTQNLTSIYSDPACLLEDYALMGTDGASGGDAADSLEFCSSAPMSGGMSLPGMLKRVVIEVKTSSNQTLGDLDYLGGADAEDGYAAPSLHVSESPVIVTGYPGMSEDMLAMAQAETEELMGEFASPTWAVPVESMDVAFFNGEEWVEEWDSVAEARMPWAIRIRINFVPAPDEEDDAPILNLDGEEEADFELVVSVPVGAGVRSEFIEQTAMMQEGAGSAPAEGDGEQTESGPAAPGSRKPTIGGKP